MNCLLCGNYIPNNTFIVNIRDTTHNNICRILRNNIIMYPTGVKLNDNLIYICSEKCCNIYRHFNEYEQDNSENKRMKL